MAMRRAPRRMRQKARGRAYFSATLCFMPTLIIEPQRHPQPDNSDSEKRLFCQIVLEDDAVVGSAGFEAGEGFVGLAHGKFFGDRSDAVPDAEFEHRVDR